MIQNDVVSIVNATIAKTQSNAMLSENLVPTQVNQVGRNDQLQTIMNRMTQMEANMNGKIQGILSNITNTNMNSRTPSEQKLMNCTGRTYTIYCPNCGVQLSPGKCSAGCVRIKRGHRNLPFPTQEAANKVTFANRSQFNNASNVYAA